MRLSVEPAIGSSIVVRVDHRTVCIGRAIENDLQILDETVSRRQVVLSTTEDGFLLENRSQHGTRLNGDLVVGSVGQLGDTILLGSVRLRLLADGEPRVADAITA